MVMTVKRVLSIMALTVMMVCLFMSVEPAVALADNNTYYGADSYGAYKLTYSGRRADIVLYPSGDGYYINLNYDIAAATAGFGKAVLFSNDVPNDMLIVHIYDPLSDKLSNFAVNDIKIYGNSVFCFDGDSVFISDDKAPGIIYRYSLDGRYQIIKLAKSRSSIFRTSAF